MGCDFYTETVGYKVGFVKSQQLSAILRHIFFFEDASCLQCVCNLFIGGKFETLLWENLNKALSVSPQKKTGKLIKIPEIKYKIY